MVATQLDVFCYALCSDVKIGFWIRPLGIGGCLLCSWIADYDHIDGLRKVLATVPGLW